MAKELLNFKPLNNHIRMKGDHFLSYSIVSSSLIDWDGEPFLRSKGQRGIRMRGGCGFPIYWRDKYGEMRNND